MCGGLRANREQSNMPGKFLIRPHIIVEVSRAFAEGTLASECALRIKSKGESGLAATGVHTARLLIRARSKGNGRRTGETPQINGTTAEAHL